MRAYEINHQLVLADGTVEPESWLYSIVLADSLGAAVKVFEDRGLTVLRAEVLVDGRPVIQAPAATKPDTSTPHFSGMLP